MNEDKEVKDGIARAVDILKTERNRIQHVIDLLEGNAEVREVDDGQPESTSRRSKKRKPRKKPPATTMKRNYIPFHKQIRAVLEEADEPLTPFKLCQLLLEKFNVKTTEYAVKKIFKIDGGREFYEPEDGLWGLVE